MLDRVAGGRIQVDNLRRAKLAYREVALKRARYDAAYWRKMAEDYRNQMKNFPISHRLRDYYENEARLCDAEAKRIEEQMTLPAGKRLGGSSWTTGWWRFAHATKAATRALSRALHRLQVLWANWK
jgi:hypothetical protein